ncbi:MAG: stomatin-like protein transmembrane protein [Candidatus Peregrinibacteria bacterium GW2011_GWF2_43_17]|nr:MAG: stomatin-like protein transmembrane protein [Candidatus Peregrinibacteria bacterium GW2011_GWF2_43_17]KKT19674.1 MAG: SPFH domain / Band 7 family protein [Candidatus Peregrinibacteria bacterium GW2011_GWA2_43_8]HAU40036.1 hypothetical protein [Candidatus Peregrinibacteria bacterium]
MAGAFVAMIVTLGIPLVILLAILIKQINEYERGVIFTLGKYSSTRLPGWSIVIPVFQSMRKVDIRIKAVDVPNQEAITKDNIAVQINAVIYYKVVDAGKAVIQVENFYYATSQFAQTTMRNIVGEVTLDQLLQSREEISEKIQNLVDKVTSQWGIQIENVELKDIVLPDNMKRTIAKQAEAERERRAVVIQSEGEVQAADNLSKAAKILSGTPGALHLRTLHSINDLSSDESNTTVWMLPIEVLEAFKSIATKK